MMWFRVKTIVDVEAEDAAEAIAVARDDSVAKVIVTPIVDEDEEAEDMAEHDDE